MTAPAIHATAVVIDGHGILIRGPSGAGKTSLAHALIDRARLYGRSAAFVADDRVHVEADAADGGLTLRTPPAIAGLAELRGRGIVPVAHVDRAPLRLVVDLEPADAIARMPEPETLAIRLDGVRLARQPVPERRPEEGARLVFAALDALAGDGPPRPDGRG